MATQIAVAVLGERERDPVEVEFVVVTPFDLERFGPLDRTARGEMAEPLVEFGQLLVGRA